jgi:hypothetical protein
MLSVGESEKIIADISLASINFFGVIISIFVGIGLVYKELEKRPSTRSFSPSGGAISSGKYLGLALTLLVMYLDVGHIPACDISYSGSLLQQAALTAVLLIYFELLIVTAAATLFSTFSTPLASGLQPFMKSAT